MNTLVKVISVQPLLRGDDSMNSSYHLFLALLLSALLFLLIKIKYQKKETKNTKFELLRDLIRKLSQCSSEEELSQKWRLISDSITAIKLDPEKDFSLTPAYFDRLRQKALRNQTKQAKKELEEALKLVVDAIRNLAAVSQKWAMRGLYIKSLNVVALYRIARAELDKISIQPEDDLEE